MQNQIDNNPQSDMLKEVARVREEAKTHAKSGGHEDASSELPEGSSPLEAREETTVSKGETPEEAPAEIEGDTDADEGPIRIGGQTFKTQREAIAYAERLEREKDLTDAHAAGIREALEATRTPVAAQPEPEDNFEERFYANPKEELKAIKAQATQDAIAAIKAETQRENLWNQFLSDYPDVRRKDAERLLNENWETIGKMTDLTHAMKVLAQKVRNEYEEIVSLSKPRTALANKSGQVVSPSGGNSRSVTPSRKEEAPLDFIAQMKRIKTHG